MSAAERLNRAAEHLREQVATATNKTRRMPMVNGVWLNSAHYLTTTPEVVAELAGVLERLARANEKGLVVGSFGADGLCAAILGAES